MATYILRIATHSNASSWLCKNSKLPGLCPGVNSPVRFFFYLPEYNQYIDRVWRIIRVYLNLLQTFQYAPRCQTNNLSVSHLLCHRNPSHWDNRSSLMATVHGELVNNINHRWNDGMSSQKGAISNTSYIVCRHCSIIHNSDGGRKADSLWFGQSCANISWPRFPVSRFPSPRCKAYLPTSTFFFLWFFFFCVPWVIDVKHHIGTVCSH